MRIPNIISDLLTMWHIQSLVLLAVVSFLHYAMIEF
jgi:hypothetical protein